MLIYVSRKINQLTHPYYRDWFRASGYWGISTKNLRHILRVCLEYLDLINANMEMFNGSILVHAHVARSELFE